MSITYKNLYTQVNDLITKKIRYNTSSPYSSQSSHTDVLPFALKSTGGDISGNIIIQSIMSILKEVIPSRILEGLAVEATSPISNQVIVRAGKGTAGCSVYEMTEDTTLTIDFDNVNQVYFINFVKDRIVVGHTAEELTIAKIVVPRPGSTVLIQDDKDDSWNAYIQSFKEYNLYGYNDKFEEDTVELLRDNIGDILADNLIGNIRLNENLKITNTLGTLELNSDSMLFNDTDGNNLLKINTTGIYFNRADGYELARFSTTGARIGNISITPTSLQSVNFLAGVRGFQIQDIGHAEFNDIVVRGTIYATLGEIGGWTIASDSLYATTTGVIKTGANVGLGQNGVMIDSAGLRVYDDTLGIVVNLPSDGSAPTFASGVINSTTINVNTSSVIQTSATVGDGSVDSAGVLINNTGLYACESNQFLSNANVKILSDGTAYFKGEITATSGTIGGVSIVGDTLVGGTIIGSLLRGATIETSDTTPRIRIDADGMYYQVTTSVGKYSTFTYGDGSKYGTGVMAYLFNMQYPILAVVGEHSMADIRMYNRLYDPGSGTGPHEKGDLIVVDGLLKVCTTAGSPGTFTAVQMSSAPLSYDWVNNGTDIYYNSGNVGVLTTAPVQALQVGSSSRAINTYVMVDAAADKEAGYLIGGDAIKWYIYRPISSDDLRFSSNTVGDVLTMLNSNGYIGLGTIAPVCQLHIKSGQPTQVIEYNSGKFLGLSATSTDARVIYDSTGYLAFCIQPNADKGTTSNITEVGTLDASGNMTLIGNITAKDHLDSAGVSIKMNSKLIVTDGHIESIVVAAGGTGYDNGATVSIAAPPAGGTQATATANITGGVITSITINNPGSGYVVDMNTPNANPFPAVTITPVSGGSGASAVAYVAWPISSITSAGYAWSSTIMRNKQRKAWGYNNNHGQMANGTGGGNPITTPLPSLFTTADGYTTVDPAVVWISDNASYSHVIVSDGTVWASGYNGSSYELGLNDTSYRYTYTALTPSWFGSKPVVKMKSAPSYWEGCTFALTSDGTLYRWGYNGLGQLGTGDTSNIAYPQALNLGVQIVDFCFAGTYYITTYLLDANGNVWSSGGNNYGQCSDGGTSNKTTFTKVQTGPGSQYLSGITQIIGGGQFNGYYSQWAALKSDGTVWMSGYGADGELGNNTGASTGAGFVSQVTGITGTVVKIFGGKCSWGGSVCSYYALTSTGALYVWGYNSNGQLGVGDTTTRNQATLCTGIATARGTATIVDVHAFYEGNSGCTMVLLSDGRLYASGYNGYGNLGNGNVTASSTFVRSLCPKRNILGLSSRFFGGSGPGCFTVYTTDGEVWVTGSNGNGQLGIGSVKEIYCWTQVIF